MTHISISYRLWKEYHLDTKDIAKLLQVHESVIYNRLDLMRAHAKGEAVWQKNLSISSSQ